MNDKKKCVDIFSQGTYVQSNIYRIYQHKKLYRISSKLNKTTNAIFYDKNSTYFLRESFFRTVVIIEIINEANYFSALRIVLTF